MAIRFEDEHEQARARPADPRVGELEHELDGLRTAYAQRAPIEQAKGIVSALTCRPPEDSFELLRLASQHLNVSVRRLATALVKDSWQREECSPTDDATALRRLKARLEQVLRSRES